MDQKEQRIDQDRDDQKSGRPVQLDKDKDKAGQQQSGGQQHQEGGQQHQQGNQPRPADRPMSEQPAK